MNIESVSLVCILAFLIGKVAFFKVLFAVGSKSFL